MRAAAADAGQDQVMPPGLLVRARELALARGSALFRLGTRPRSMFVVIAGDVHLTRVGHDGRPLVLHRVRAGLVAEASLDSPRYHCDAFAATDVALLRVPIEEFRAALDEDPRFQRRYRDALARELRRARARCERLMLRGVAERIVHYIECEGADGALRLDRHRKDWAAELGVTHEALYRTLRRMADEGTLAIEGAVVVLQRARRRAEIA